jgi:DNA-directed RNA polymerase specialized sigma24 family protein
MPVITIPFDYDEKLHPLVVPICICDTDLEGNMIHPDWFERGVAPVADNLRRVAQRALNDVWRVSEITEHAVHSIWRNRGSDLGTNPGLIVYKRAKWYAEDLRAGGRRARIGTEVELFSETVDHLRDQFDLISQAENEDTLDKLVAKATELGMTDVVAMVPMMLRGCSAEQYVKRFGKKRNTLAQMFFRNMRKAADAADISW